MTLVSVGHHKTCGVDINTQATESEAVQLKESFTSVFLDGNHSTCEVCFESGQRLLEITFTIPNSGHDLEFFLVGRHLNCKEPFTVVYTGLSATSVKEQQCMLREQEILDSGLDRVRCQFVCPNALCVENEIQVTTLLESHTWRVGNHPGAQLCEVFPQP